MVVQKVRPQRLKAYVFCFRHRDRIVTVDYYDVSDLTAPYLLISPHGIAMLNGLYFTTVFFFLFPFLTSNVLGH